MEYNFKDGHGLVPAHRHCNGGGWVADTASVDSSAFVGEDALVYGNARVYGDARVSEYALVYGNAMVSDSSFVSGSAKVYGRARVSGNAGVYGDARVSEYALVCGDARVSDSSFVSGSARVYGDAQVYVCASVFGNAKVYGNAIVTGGSLTRDALCISGGKFICRVESPGTVSFGCLTKTVDEWEALSEGDVLMIARREGVESDVGFYVNALPLLAMYSRAWEADVVCEHGISLEEDICHKCNLENASKSANKIARDVE